MSARVLVVDRNPKIGGLVSGQLRERGFEAADCLNGAEAVVQLRQSKADVILLDDSVPMGGVKTARILRMHGKYNTIPIVLGLPPEKAKAVLVIKEAQEAGLSHFLPKPYTLSALQKKLGEIVESDEPVAVPTHQEIREEIQNLANLPAMPAAHSKLLVLLSKADEEVDMRQVSATLEQDPALSAKVMKTCSTAYFGFQGNLMSQAIAFLGVAVIRKIVQSAVVYSMFGGDEEKSNTAALPMNELWKHSLATGMVMEIIGKTDKKRTHFLLGSMHDIGKAVLKFRFADHYAKVLELVEAENVSILHAEFELLGITHADCGGELAIHWGLPAEVRTAITSHHQPGNSTQHRRLAAMVHIADIAVREMGIGYGGDPLIPTMDPYAQRLQKSVEDVTSQKEDIISQCDSILGSG